MEQLLQSMSKRPICSRMHINRDWVAVITSMEYDLSSILTAHSLDHLDAAFSLEEIESVIKNLPNSHAPGPDGFNGLFIKQCWNILKDDFFRLFNDFYQSNIDLRSINSSIIALIPKKDNPTNVDDFRQFHS